RTGAAVDIEEDRIARRGVEMRRLDEGGGELDAGTDIDLPALRSTEPQPGEFRLQRRIVHQRTQGAIVRQTHERDRRRHAKAGVRVYGVPVAGRHRVAVPARFALGREPLRGPALRVVDAVE